MDKQIHNAHVIAYLQNDLDKALETLLAVIRWQREAFEALMAERKGGAA